MLCFCGCFFCCCCVACCGALFFCCAFLFASRFIYFPTIWQCFLFVILSIIIIFVSWFDYRWTLLFCVWLLRWHYEGCDDGNQIDDLNSNNNNNNNMNIINNNDTSNSPSTRQCKSTWLNWVGANAVQNSNVRLGFVLFSAKLFCLGCAQSGTKTTAKRWYIYTSDSCAINSSSWRCFMFRNESSSAKSAASEALPSLLAREDVTQASLHMRRAFAVRLRKSVASCAERAVRRSQLRDLLTSSCFAGKLPRATIPTEPRFMQIRAALRMVSLCASRSLIEKRAAKLVATRKPYKNLKSRTTRVATRSNESKAERKDCGKEWGKE